MSYYGLYGVMLISAVMLMISADAVLADNDFAMTLSDPKVSQHATFDPPSPNDSRRKHHMRTHAEIMADDEGDSDEDRAFEGIRASIAKGKDLLQRVMNKIKKFFSAMKSKIMSTKHQKINNYFKELMPKDVKTFKFGTQDFQEWERYAHRVYSKRPGDADVAMMATLTTHFGDARLLQMLFEAEKVPQTNAVATRLMEALSRYWLSTKKNADDVFTLLRLYEKEKILLTDPMVMAWISYVGKFDEEGQIRLVWSVLKTYFKEEALAKMIFAAKNDEYMRDVAQKLEAMQFASWLKSDSPIDTAYKALNVHYENGNPFEEIGFNIWATFVKLAEPENPYEILMTKLKALNGDRALAELLAVEKARHFSVYVANFEELQYRGWLDQQKTADDIFTLLQLNLRGERIFEEGVWHTWVSYLAKLEEQTGEKQEALMYSVLKKYYNEEDMMDLIDIAMIDRDTEPIGVTLLYGMLKEKQVSGIDLKYLSPWLDKLAAVSISNKKFDEDGFDLALLLYDVKVKTTNTDHKNTIAALELQLFTKWKDVNHFSVKDVLNGVVYQRPLHPRGLEVFLSYRDFYNMRKSIHLNQ